MPPLTKIARQIALTIENAISALLERSHATAADSLRPWQIALRWFWLGLIGALLAAVAYFFWQSRSALLLALESARYGYFVLTLLSYLAATFTVCFGWHSILLWMNPRHTFWTNAKIYFAAQAGRRLPGTIWYIAGRVLLYRRLGTSARIVTLASGLEILFGIISGIFIGAPSVLLSGHFSWTRLAAFMTMESIAILLLYPRFLPRLLSRICRGYSSQSLAAPRLVGWIALYGGTWVWGGFMMSSVVYALHPLDPILIPFLISSWAISGVIAHVSFLLPHSFGISEIAISYCLSTVMPLHLAIATALILRFITSIIDIAFLGFMFLLRNTAPALADKGDDSA